MTKALPLLTHIRGMSPVGIFNLVRIASWSLAQQDFEMPLSNVLLSLWPRTMEAKEVVTLPSNRHLVYWENEQQVLNLGHAASHVAQYDPCCIATMGREGDIALPKKWTAVSNIHCAFAVGADGCCITFVDKSGNKSCQAYADNSTHGLLSNGSRQVDSSCGLRQIEFSIDHSSEPRKAVFDIIWRCPAADLASALRAWRPPKLGDTQLWQVETDSQKTRQAVAAMTDEDLDRFVRQRLIGRGAFGDVYEARDPRSKMVVAVKVQMRVDDAQWRQVEREVMTMSKLDHENIIKFLGCRVHGNEARLFMSLQTGSLADLVNNGETKHKTIVRTALHDILKGLDYLHSKGYVHRDVKPKNILYTLKNERLSFCIADLGLINSESSARTFCGTPAFLAPEIYYRQSQEQTPAVDMWSLLMTVVWILDLANYRSQPYQDYPDMLMSIVSVISDLWKKLEPVQGLASLDYHKRATAAQMLVRHYGGEGLTTRLENVPKWQPVVAPNVRDIPRNTVIPPQAAPKDFARRSIAPKMLPPWHDVVGRNIVPRAPILFKPRHFAKQDIALKMSPPWHDVGRNIVPRAAVFGERAKMAVTNAQRKRLVIANGLGQHGGRKAVPEGELIDRIFAARVVGRENRVAKKPAAPQAKPMADGRGANGEREVALKVKKLPLDGPKAACWVEALKIPGAFPV